MCSRVLPRSNNAYKPASRCRISESFVFSRHLGLLLLRWPISLPDQVCLNDTSSCRYYRLVDLRHTPWDELQALSDWRPLPHPEINLISMTVNTDSTVRNLVRPPRWKQIIDSDLLYMKMSGQHVIVDVLWIPIENTRRARSVKLEWKSEQERSWWIKKMQDDTQTYFDIWWIFR